ncbi:MAG: hypothetical protein JOZ19_04945 [Rubrobacter sp.]|nr:hypothetical protein [Rubrobacter sp.]
MSRGKRPEHCHKGPRPGFADGSADGILWVAPTRFELAAKVEAEVWQVVSGPLKETKTLRADLDAMVESERHVHRSRKGGKVVDGEPDHSRPQEITLPGHGSRRAHTLRRTV